MELHRQDRSELLDNDPAKGPKANNVRFEEYLSVVLIPHRNEYKQANCNLWWSKMDFFKFQRLAYSEIRLLSILQNISFQEAKKKLYQPDVDPEGTCWQYLVRDPTPPSSAQNTPEISQQSRKSLASKRTPCLDLEADQPVAQQDSWKPPFSPHPGNRDRTASWEESGDEKINTAMTRSKSGEESADLHFCVPLREKVLLAQKEYNSVAKKHFKDHNSVAITLAMISASLFFPLLCYYFLRW